MSQGKARALDNLKHTYCRIKPSKLHNVGVFAIRDIPKGIKPFPGMINQRWYKFHINQFKKLDKEILTMIDHFFLI